MSDVWATCVHVRDGADVETQFAFEKGDGRAWDTAGNLLGVIRQIRLCKACAKGPGGKMYVDGTAVYRVGPPVESGKTVFMGDAPGGNYTEEVMRLGREVAGQAGVHVVNVAHDDGCAIWRNLACNCVPEVSREVTPSFTEPLAPPGTGAITVTCIHVKDGTKVETTLSEPQADVKAYGPDGRAVGEITEIRLCRRCAKRGAPKTLFTLDKVPITATVPEKYICREAKTDGEIIAGPWHSEEACAAELFTKWPALRCTPKTMKGEGRDCPALLIWPEPGPAMPTVMVLGPGFHRGIWDRKKARS